MKTILITGSPALPYQEPRRIPPYMAAIIRRHRFTIIAIICFIILMLLGWHFHSKEESIYDNSNHEIQMPESDKQYSSGITKIYNNIEGEQPKFINIGELPEYEKKFPFVSTKAVKESTKYQVEEHFIPTDPETNEFTKKLTRQHEEKFVTGDKETPRMPAILHHDTEFPLPPNIDPAIDTKYPYLEESPITIPNGHKPVSISTKEGFLAKDRENEWEKREFVTFSVSNNGTDKMGAISTNKNFMLNQTQSSAIKSNISSTENAVLLIDTPGCKIPRLDPWDPTVKHLIELQDPYVCPGAPLFMNSNPGGSIALNKTILETYYNMTPEELVCYYQPIYRKHEEEWSEREISFFSGNVIKLEFGAPLGEDHVAVSCKLNGKQYEQYFPLVRLKENVEVERNSLVPPNPNLNVILIGIDSVSKLNFLRHFPRTHAFLNEKLKPFEMNGYTKVGDNTFPNLVPMLTGQFVEYWWNETVKNTMFFDNVGFIWKKYAKRGYRTFYAEDNPFAGTFNYIKRGFYNPPTDYYFRPLALALEMWKYLVKPEKEFCLNSQLDFDMIYKYLQDFAKTMGSRPYFGFAMVSTITHDKLNKAGWADEPTVRLLEGLLNDGSLNNTLLVLFSDHGLRFGEIRHTYVGKFEERLPLMYIHVPKWFLDQYPEIAKNLQINQDRLMTLFDIHATMLHQLDLSKTQTERSKRTLGRSLFEEISPNRTCDDAYIQTHWCPCQEFDIVDSNSPEAINASQAIMNDINSKLEPFQKVCEVLEVDTIMDARVGKANDLLLQYLRTENEVINKTVYVGDEVAPLDDYMITLVAKPGGAIFEGTVRHNAEDNSYSVLGLSRISMYGTTSWCIDSQKLKIFCYCKVQ
ncbi:hypothetical protein AVEN_144621-1 [Araneus ventricosus]|uniref:Uncharacterized protein n=1 Tax=Araneus ventricosus TaxID=182803 RepID=A0A4Y2C0C7_ARAVE|nr:hypothetical protein AVEN_144621-1 [Araneus ventricosus]